jgi:diguanylate cyclase (GGDEF)-like protein
VASSARLAAAIENPARLAALTDARVWARDPDPIFDILARLAATAVQSPMATVSLLDSRRAHLVGIAGVPQPWADAREVAASRSFCQHVVANQAPLVVADTRADPVLGIHRSVNDLGVVAYAGFPIVTAAGWTLGSLAALDREPRAWQAADLEALREIALLVSREVERLGLVRRAAAEARTDALTGLPSRRAWDDELERAVQRAKRLRHPLAISLVELDHFSVFNEHHGQAAGDQALRDVAACWSRSVRDVDLLARIVGQEFGLILLGCDAQAAVRAAARMLEATPDGLTASAGVAAWNASLGDGELLELADRALYQAKRDGGDRVVLGELAGRHGT